MRELFQSIQGLNGTLLAAWVQAVGSVLAIVAAIIIPRYGAKSGLKQATTASKEIAALIRCRIDDLVEFQIRVFHMRPSKPAPLI